MKTVWNDHVGYNLFPVHYRFDHLAWIINSADLTKKTNAKVKAMVLRFLSDSREISFRLDDCPTRNSGELLPIGVIKVYMILGYKSTKFENCCMRLYMTVFQLSLPAISRGGKFIILVHPSRAFNGWSLFPSPLFVTSTQMDCDNSYPIIWSCGFISRRSGPLKGAQLNKWNGVPGTSPISAM